MPVDSPEDLYGLPLEQFTQERTALAKRLRADKQPEVAKRVSALRKPTTAAWAVNQLVRTQAKVTRALFEAGDRIAEAQAAGREGAADLREAAKEQRIALDKLMEAADGLLSADGHGLSASTLERVSETLRAAALDPEAREQVEQGCLTQELQSSGFIGLAAVPRPRSPAPKSRRSAPTHGKDRGGEAAKGKARKAAEQKVTKARRQAEKVLGQLKEAERDHEQAAAALEAAQEAAEEAAARLAEAQAQAQSAANDLKQAEREARGLSD